MIVKVKEILTDVDPASDPCIVKVQVPVFASADQSNVRVDGLKVTPLTGAASVQLITPVDVEGFNEKPGTTQNLLTPTELKS